MRETQAVRLIKLFAHSIKKKNFFLLLFFFFFFLPGENFYEKLRIELKKPLVRGVEIDLPEPPAYPINVTETKAPFLTAKSAVMIDVPSKVVILAKNPNFRLLPASTTKIMTALIVLENYKLDNVLVVPKLDDLIGRNMELLGGEKITVENLLYGLLVHSANDAALTLSSRYSGGIEEFIYLMNKKANELGLFNTHFANISGIDQANHYSTVRDLAHLAVYAMKNPIFSEMVSTSKVTVSDVDKNHWHDLENTNELIGEVDGLKGVKTGWTEKAGECLVSYVERNSRKIITVLLGSRDRFGETKKLIDWVFGNYSWQEITPSTQD